MEAIFNFAMGLYEHLPEFWTFFLLVIRYSALLMLLPGIAGGQSGMRIRTPAILLFALISLPSGQIAPLPQNEFIMIAQMSSEFMFGFLLAFAPAMVSSGVQMAAQLSTGTMGLGAAQLMDPTMGVSVSSLGRIIDGVIICVFLSMGGHHAVLYVASGLGGSIVPGTFIIGADTIDIIIRQTGSIFLMGVMLSAPVIVALLLTQFVMGLISKAVPSVNIFIVSFPLTIGIGLILTTLSLPEMLVYAERKFAVVEQEVLLLSESTKRVDFDPIADNPLTRLHK